MIRTFEDARNYLQGVRLNFDKTMAQDMKDALELADKALAMVIIESKNIAYISPMDMEGVKDEEV